MRRTPSCRFIQLCLRPFGSIFCSMIALLTGSLKNCAFQAQAENNYYHLSSRLYLSLDFFFLIFLAFITITSRNRSIPARFRSTSVYIIYRPWSNVGWTRCPTRPVPTDCAAGPTRFWSSPWWIAEEPRYSPCRPRKGSGRPPVAWEWRSEMILCTARTNILRMHKRTTK